MLTALCPATFMARSRGQHAAKEVNENEPADACAEAGIEVQRSLRAIDHGQVIGLSRHWDGLGSTSAMWRRIQPVDATH
jgi:hypothetical protein